MRTGPTDDVAILIRGSAADAAVTVRGVKATAGSVPYAIYLVLDATAPAEALNRAAAIRTECLLLFLDAGVTPVGTSWLTEMTAAVSAPDVAAAIATWADDRGPVAGLLVRREAFDLLGGFDADRHPTAGYTEDLLARFLYHGLECMAPAGAVFLAGSPQLRRAG